MKRDPAVVPQIYRSFLGFPRGCPNINRQMRRGLLGGVSYPLPAPGVLADEGLLRDTLLGCMPDSRSVTDNVACEMCCGGRVLHCRVDCYGDVLHRLRWSYLAGHVSDELVEARLVALWYDSPVCRFFFVFLQGRKKKRNQNRRCEQGQEQG